MAHGLNTHPVAELARLPAIGGFLTGKGEHADRPSSGLGIDLGDQGKPTFNNSGPAGPNYFQNFPVMSTAVLNGNNVMVLFTFTTLPSSTFRVEFFLNNAGTAAQGQTILGTVNVTMDSKGVVTSVTSGMVNGVPASVILTPPAGITPAVGQVLTATATLLTTPGSTGSPSDTSEFASPTIAIM
jgi:hypothetical protein